MTKCRKPLRCTDASRRTRHCHPSAPPQSQQSQHRHRPQHPLLLLLLPMICSASLGPLQLPPPPPLLLLQPRRPLRQLHQYPHLRRHPSLSLRWRLRQALPRCPAWRPRLDPTDDDLPASPTPLPLPRPLRTISSGFWVALLPQLLLLLQRPPRPLPLIPRSRPRTAWMTSSRRWPRGRRQPLPERAAHWTRSTPSLDHLRHHLHHQQQQQAQPSRPRRRLPQWGSTACSVG
mmetsp:Transcript_8571/g.26926  ORF Transcript_8571/g.26926 Transcript_8571/m.26926 type:complete len:232 (+) Transcript_8571:927-1622(+)